MTQLEQFLNEKKISFYKATQILGKNPATTSANITSKIKGELAFKLGEYELLCQKLGQYLHEEVKPERFNFDVDTLKMR